jgi:ABC-type multidrug transport system fused ATPase/permease subunit
LSLLDIDMPFCFGFVVSGVLELLGILGVIAVVTWEMLILAVPMVYLVQKLQHYYVRSAQELMRLNATTKAPIVNFSGEAAQGAATIRAFGMVDAFKRKNLCLIDNDSTLYFHNAAALEWLIQRLELLSNAFLCATGLLLVIFPTSSPGPAMEIPTKTRIEHDRQLFPGQM